MTRTLRILGWTALAGLLLSVLLVASAVAIVGAIDPTVIEINGETMNLAQFGVGHGVVAVAGVLLAGLVVLVVLLFVVPFALLVPVLVLGLVGAGMLLALAGVAALLFSPLILVVGAVWLVWRMLRGNSAARRARAGATIPG